MFTFVLINESSADPSPLAAQLPAALPRIAAAITAQMQVDLASIYPEASNAFVRVASSPTDLVPGEIAFAVVPSLPDAPGAVAYHDVEGDDVPVAFLALDTCSTLDDVSTAISHECCETVGDAGCNKWADDGKGHEYACELSDAVESSTYLVDLKDGQAPVRVSDFLLPSFFDVAGQAPYSFMQSKGLASYPTGPFVTAPGGYQIQRTSGGNETQVTASLPLKRLAAKMHWSSRCFRRGARVRATKHQVPNTILMPPLTVETTVVDTLDMRAVLAAVDMLDAPVEPQETADAVEAPVEAPAQEAEEPSST